MRSHLHPPLLALACLFVALCLVYNATVPLFEAPDEYDHVDYADWLAGGNGLPHLVDDRERVGEIWQPPLYYALMAAVIAPIDRSGLETLAPLNGEWQAGLSRVAHLHGPAESFPYAGPALAVHLARSVSTLLGLVTVLATYAIGRLVVPRYAIVAACLVALNPQFIFLSAVVNNDNLVIALSSVTVLILLLLLKGGKRSAGHAKRRQLILFILLGAAWGLATLAKLTGLTLGLVIGLALLFMARRQRSWRPLITGGLLVGGTAALVCGWWFWRNWQLYGDPIAWNEMLAVTAGLLRPELLSWPETIRYATFMRKTYWAMFGYGVAAPESFYWMTYAIGGLALAGLARRAAAGHGSVSEKLRSVRPEVWLLLVWSLTVLAFLLRWMRQIEATNQGRLLFPAVAALAVLAALGLSALDGRRKWLGKGVAGVLGGWSAALPLLIIVPAYAQPVALPESAIPANAGFRFGDGIQLRGYELPDSTDPGRPLDIRLYWEATRPIDGSYVVALRILDAHGRPATGLDSLPFGGRYSTAIWQPESVFRDTYRLPETLETASAGLGELVVILYPLGNPDAPLPVTAGGAPAGNEAHVARLKIAPISPPSLEPSRPIGVSFDNRFGLTGYDATATIRAGDGLLVTLYWEGLQPDGRDYTVFVHLVDGSGELIAQSDSPPQAGVYPTSIWDVGERVVDERSLTVAGDTAPGDYLLLVGLYDPETGTRLPAYDQGGQRYANDAVELASLRIAAPAPDE